MTGNLRDRILTVLATGPDDITALADALIEELHLRQEHGRLRVIRYVSDWEPVDDYAC